VTSPGRAVRALVTDLGILEKPGGSDELVLTAVPAGPEPLATRVDAARAACGWELAVAPGVRELTPPTPEEIAALRSWDPRGWFLRER
jgi:glutaconate CoA-transferase subunit B